MVIASNANQCIAIVAILLALSGCKREAMSSGTAGGEEQAPWFEEISASAGIDFQHVSGHQKRYLFPEIMAGGVCLLDYDNDGDLDIYFVQAGNELVGSKEKIGNRLYRNQGDATFEDVTDKAGVGGAGYGVGCSCADFDNDGNVDIYTTNIGPNDLLRNNGDGTFTEMAGQLGVDDASWGTSSLFADFDGDGWLDLLIANYVDWSVETERDCHSPAGLPDYCHPLSYGASALDSLYRNVQGERFENARNTSGIEKSFGTGLGVASGDFNRDGRMDFYVANDGMANRLWINQGGGRLVDEGLVSGCALNQSGRAEAGMGVAAVDFDADGDLDLFMSHLRGETNTLYRNRDGTFEDMTVQFGLAGASLAFTGFGLGFADFNNDTYQDLYIANGRVALFRPRIDKKHPYAEPNQLFVGSGNASYDESMPIGGTKKSLIATSRGAAFGDLNNDGKIDIVVVNKDAAPYVLKNISSTNGRWIMFRVLNRDGRDAIGAMVRVSLGSASQWRQVQPGYSYCSSNDPRIHFGLGEAERVDGVMIRWPNGQEESFGTFEAGKIYKLQQSK